MAMGMPFDPGELMGDLFGFLIVDSDDVVLAPCAEFFSVRRIIQSHCEVAFFEILKDFLPCFSNILINVAVGVGY